SHSPRISTATPAVRFLDKESTTTGVDHIWHCSLRLRLRLRLPLSSGLRLSSSSALISELQLDPFMIGYEFEVNNLAWTISGITTLQALSLKLVPVYYSHCVGRSAEIVPHSTILTDTDILRDQPPARRQEPLYRLKKFMGAKSLFELAHISVILQHCPELVSMNVPSVQLTNSVDHTAAAITELCPKLNSLSQLGDGDDIAEPLMMTIMDRLPQDTLESFVYFWHQMSNNRLDTYLGRHFNSLRRIELDECGSVRQELIPEILFNCRVLEVLALKEAKSNDLEITVGDLVTGPWASTKFVELALVVDIGLIRILMNKNRIDFTEEEKAKVLFLEKFYRQIGILTALKILQLNVLVTAMALDMEEEPLAHRDFIFPGFLTLGDEDDEGRWGCLGELAGLKNLEVVRGSFNMESTLTLPEFEQGDTAWMRMNWARLHSMEFFLPYYYNEETDQVHPLHCLASRATARC
ncbi:hypothetical protein BGX23_004893, partial [Mortierella sp. AD031]